MDIITTLNKNLEDFKASIVLVDGEQGQSVRFGASADESGGYYFNQKETIDLIDLYYNSKYRDGKLDNEGQRKLFMNIVQFKANVAEKQTDIDTKNYLFIPDGESDANLVWFLKRQFQVWSRENDYGQILNDLNKDYSKYGSCVLKRTKKTVERVPLRYLMNNQDATSLKTAPLEGGYVIIKHKLTAHQANQFPDWKEVEYEGKKDVYEMYSLQERGELEGEEGDELVLTVSYVCPELEDDPILFAEQIDEVPLEEAHWDKQDGRWLGIGEVEKQFENQVAINMTENLRRKHLIYGAKRIWQTQGNAVVKNLSKQVQDGAVLEVGANGMISEVPMASQNLQEFELSKSGWMQNSDQKAFAFEVTTGESFDRSTPFRLGVILANSAARYYELKRENFGLFLYRSFFSQLIPIFKKQTKAHNVAVANGEEGTEFIKEAVMNHNINRKFFAKLLNGELPVLEKIKTDVEKEINSSPFMFVGLPDKAYDSIKFKMTLDITGEAVDKDAEMATLTTLFQTLSQNQDPRADDILNQILSLTGRNPNKLLANSTAVKQQLTQQGSMPQMDLTALNNSQSNAIAE